MTRLGDLKDAALWIASGRPVPPPPLVKRAVIRRAGRGLPYFVETGTHKAETLLAVAGSFDRLWSIELDPGLYGSAVEKTEQLDHVSVLQGDSSVVLPEVLEVLPGPALFWLDGHWSGGGTARADLDTPIVSELEAILARPAAGHVVLIDDARLFVGRGGYPTIAQLREMVVGRFRCSVRHDIIRLTPL